MKKKKIVSRGILIVLVLWLFVALFQISPILSEEYTCQWFFGSCEPYEHCHGEDTVVCTSVPECRGLCRAVCMHSGEHDWLRCEPGPW